MEDVRRLRWYTHVLDHLGRDGVRRSELVRVREALRASAFADGQDALLLARTE
jgi:hypothetical protein